MKVARSIMDRGKRLWAKENGKKKKKNEMSFRCIIPTAQPDELEAMGRQAQHRKLHLLNSFSFEVIS